MDDNLGIFFILFYFLFQSNDGAEYCGSIYHKIRKDLEGGVKLSWSSAKSTALELGTKYKIDSDSSVSVSHSNCQVSCNYV